jgi:peptidoglycan/xylan/chitin deacetylase (PgdA/CDA1 family)
MSSHFVGGKSVTESSTVPAAHNRFEFSPIVQRNPLRWPNGARVAVWVIPNIEHFLLDRPATSLVSLTAPLVPDVLNYSWRDYGVRVGIWRMMDVMERYGVKGTVALNADVCGQYPQIIEAGKKLGWEWMGHGRNNSTLMAGLPEAAERQVIRDIYRVISQSTGEKPRGWLGPALTETHNTLDLLAETGFDYVCDWVNDEQPYAMKVKSGRMTSIPYSLEINDLPAILELKQSPAAFGQMIRDQFDVLYEDGAASGRVMSICLHPFIIGHPFRSKYFAEALQHITSRKEVWLATGSQIIDAYLEQTK